MAQAYRRLGAAEVTVGRFVPTLMAALTVHAI